MHVLFVSLVASQDTGEPTQPTPYMRFPTTAKLTETKVKPHWLILGCMFRGSLEQQHVPTDTLSPRLPVSTSSLRMHWDSMQVSLAGVSDSKRMNRRENSARALTLSSH